MNVITDPVISEALLNKKIVHLGLDHQSDIMKTANAAFAAYETMKEGEKQYNRLTPILRTYAAEKRQVWNDGKSIKDKTTSVKIPFYDSNEKEHYFCITFTDRWSVDKDAATDLKGKNDKLFEACFEEKSELSLKKIGKETLLNWFKELGVGDSQAAMIMDYCFETKTTISAKGKLEYVIERLNEDERKLVLACVKRAEPTVSSD